VGDLSKNFSRHELRCPCCLLYKPNPLLIESLQKLRDIVGVPITPDSVCRCKKHNREVGGSRTSQHLLGNAADIVIAHMLPNEMQEAALLVDAFRDGGIGVYPSRGFIHVDVRGRRARWTG